MKLSGHKLREARRSVGWTQADLAYAAGMSRSFLSQVESGQRGVSEANAVAIAQLLGVEVLDLAEPKQGTAVCYNCGSVVPYTC
jgi:transcriptional regulator with XRE-family HTH domain